MTNVPKRMITITIDELILNKMDSKRGLITRSAWIQDVVSQDLKKGDSRK